jgi:tetratricopeptide (TPR) repeat protein
VLVCGIVLVNAADAQKRADDPAALDAEMVRLYQAGKYTEATEIAKQSLAINEKVQGHQHPEVATSLNNLALLFQELGRYADAEPLLTQSLSIFEKLPDHPD